MPYTVKHRSRIGIRPISLVLLAVIIGLAGYGKFHHHTTLAATKTGATTRPTQTDTVKPAAQATAQPTAHVDAGLQQIVDNWAAGHSFKSSVVVQELDGSKRSAARGSDSQMTTASTYKIYVAYAVLHSVEQGTFGTNTVTRSGQTVQAALQKMILQSDNNSAEALGFLVGWDKINALAAAAGATHTDINNYNSAGVAVNGDKLSTVADLSLMMQKLQQGTLLNAADTSLLLGLMKTQVWRERVPAGVPKGVSVADKPGWLTGTGGNVQNDAAIVYGAKSTYLLVIMTNGSATQPLADLSRTVYGYLQS
jgi:beta-lactamase class A